MDLCQKGWRAQAGIITNPPNELGQKKALVRVHAPRAQHLAEWQVLQARFSHFHCGNLWWSRITEQGLNSPDKAEQELCKQAC